MTAVKKSIVTAVLFSIIIHITLVIAVIILIDDTDSKTNKEPPILKITISQAAHTSLQPELLSKPEKLLKPEALLKPEERSNKKSRRANTNTVVEPITSQKPASDVQPESRAKSKIVKKSIKVPEQQKILSSQDKNQKKLPESLDRKAFSHSTDSIVPATNSVTEDASSTSESGLIFNPNLRKDILEAKRFNHQRAATIENLNNGRTPHGDELVSAGNKCFTKKRMSPTDREYMYYPTKCFGKKTESEIIAESLRQATQKFDLQFKNQTSKK